MLYIGRFRLSRRSKTRRAKRDQSGLIAATYEKKGPNKVRLLKKHPRINKQPIRTEYIEASIRAKVEHPFRIIKRQFGFRKVVYRGLEKNDNKLAMLFALANVFRIDQITVQLLNRRFPR